MDNRVAINSLSTPAPVECLLTVAEHVVALATMHTFPITEPWHCCAREGYQGVLEPGLLASRCDTRLGHQLQVVARHNQGLLEPGLFASTCETSSGHQLQVVARLNCSLQQNSHGRSCRTVQQTFDTCTTKRDVAGHTGKICSKQAVTVMCMAPVRHARSRVCAASRHLPRHRLVSAPGNWVNSDGCQARHAVAPVGAHWLYSRCADSIHGCAARHRHFLLLFRRSRRSVSCASASAAWLRSIT